MRNILERLKAGEVLVSDGALGTMLYSKGLEQGRCAEEWNVSHPEEVYSVAKAYVDAGSDMITTNTFQGSRFTLARHGYDSRVTEFNRKGVELARRAAGDSCIVAASIGPTGKFLQPLGDATENELADAFREQCEAAGAGGADAILVETMTDVGEAKVAVRTAKESTGLPVLCTLTFDKTSRGYFTIMGVSVERGVAEILDAGADVVGSNCGNGIEQMIEIAREMTKVSAAPVLCQPNAGLPQIVDGKPCYVQTPEIMAGFVRELLDAGVRIIGGCCGTTPGHIRAVAAIVKNV